jgi:hypothetical protein
MRRRLSLGVLALTLVAASATATWAATIRGTNGRDTLRGTAGADRISGKSGKDTLYGLGGNDVLNGGPGNDVLYGGPGNDRLYGGAGNDTLIGGPGADRYVCGPGRDTVRGDPKDTAAKDCEVVKGLKPAPLPEYAPPGRYCGFTIQGQSICFTVDASGRTFSSAHFGVTPACSPSQPTWVFTIDFPDNVGIASDGSFSYDVGSGDLVGSYVRGTIDSSGSASGTMHLPPQSFDKEGYGHFDCASEDATWQATRQH